MRRSDAILIVEKVLLQHYGDLTYGVAQEILTVLEKSGLKPPLTKRCPVLLTTINYWEPETNET